MGEYQASYSLGPPGVTLRAATTPENLLILTPGHIVPREPLSVLTCFTNLFLFSSVIVDVYCQLDLIQNYLGNRPLQMSVLMILITLIQVGGPTQCGWHHSLAEIQTAGMEKGNWAAACVHR